MIEYDFCPHREYLVAVSHKVKSFHISVNWLLCYRFFEKKRGDKTAKEEVNNSKV